MSKRTPLPFFFVLLTALFAALGAACSSSGGGGSTQSAVELQGVYYAKDPGPYAWIAFLDANSAVLFSSEASCAVNQPAGSCYQTGPYTYDADQGTLAVTDFRSSKTTTLSVGILSVGSSETMSERLALDDLTSGGGSLTSGGGSLSSSSGSLTPATGISLSSSNGSSQQLTGSGSQLASACSTAIACICALVIAITPPEGILPGGGGVNPEEPVKIEQPMTECPKSGQG